VDKIQDIKKKLTFALQLKKLDLIMAKEKNDDSLIDVENVFSKTELFIEEHKKNITIILSAIVIVVGGYFAYKYLYIAGEEEAASKEMFKAEQYFNQDDYEKAINGDVTNAVGFTQIVEDYGMTPSGNLAQYYLGISLLKTGKFDEAIEHLEEFESDDQIIGPQATAAIGDAYLELNKKDEAITYYLKAAEQNANSFNTPLFLKKAALVNEEKGSCPAAIQLYERIKNEFPETETAREMDKYIARAKVIGNIE
jgi:tetratricopeptide (TPR) repeat protein